MKELIVMTRQELENKSKEYTKRIRIARFMFTNKKELQEELNHCKKMKEYILIKINEIEKL